MGVVTPVPLSRTYPDGFPDDVIEQLHDASGRGILCNKPYSGTAVIEDFGAQHLATGDLIVYTSADSVLQIAAHVDEVPPAELYAICAAAREIMSGEHAGRPRDRADRSGARRGRSRRTQGLQGHRRCRRQRGLVPGELCDSAMPTPSNTWPILPTVLDRHARRLAASSR